MREGFAKECNPEKRRSGCRARSAEHGYENRLKEQEGESRDDAVDGEPAFPGERQSRKIERKKKCDHFEGDPPCSSDDHPSSREEPNRAVGHEQQDEG